MWKNFVEPVRPQMTIWRIRIACWIPKTTNTFLEYVILIVFQCNNCCTNASHLCVIVHSLSFLVCLFVCFLERVYISFINLCWLSQEWDGTNDEADEGGSIPRRFTITPKATLSSTQHSAQWVLPLETTLSGTWTPLTSIWLQYWGFWFVSWMFLVPI